jgi:RimJ/RimL family protein N-acetyltransferase
MSNDSVNLHTVEALKEIKVRDDIVLRPLGESDASRILHILEDDPSIRNRVSIAQRMTHEDSFIKEVEAYKADSDVIRYSILVDNRVIGLISFWRLGDTLMSYIPGSLPEPNTYGFGYFIDPSERGKGIASDAMKAVLHTAREQVNPQKFIAFCEDDNTASMRVLEKSGFSATDIIVYFPDENWHERMYIIEV